MSLVGLLNPVPPQLFRLYAELCKSDSECLDAADTADSNLYQFLNMVYDALNALSSLSNVSILSNANFNTLGTNGYMPLTQADGDGASFISNWQIFGAANADYSIGPDPYPLNSTVISKSLQFTNITISSYTSGDVYIFQEIDGNIRQFQSQPLTFTLQCNNNQSAAIKVIFDIFTYYDPTSMLISSREMVLLPGLNTHVRTIDMPSLAGITVGMEPYTQFRMRFTELNAGTANLDIYQLKCESGVLSTPYEL